jgi:hypothetical protein
MSETPGTIRVYDATGEPYDIDYGLSEADVLALAEEAERGYDPAKIRPGGRMTNAMARGPEVGELPG